MGNVGVIKLFKKPKKGQNWQKYVKKYTYMEMLFFVSVLRELCSFSGI